MKKILGVGLLLLCGFMQAPERRLPKKVIAYVTREEFRSGKPCPSHAAFSVAIFRLAQQGKTSSEILLTLQNCQDESESMHHFSEVFDSRHPIAVAAQSAETSKAPVTTSKKRQKFMRTSVEDCNEISDVDNVNRTTQGLLAPSKSTRCITRDEVIAIDQRTNREMAHLGQLFLLCQTSAQKRGCSVSKILDYYANSGIVPL